MIKNMFKIDLIVWKLGEEDHIYDYYTGLK